MKSFKQTSLTFLLCLFICSLISISASSQTLSLCGNTQIEELDLGNYSLDDCLDIPEEVLVIPVVFHVFYSDPASAYSVDYNTLLNNLNTLNLSFDGSLGLNVNTPATDTKIQFCLAQSLPNGLPFPDEPGVIRVNSTGSSYEPLFTSPGWQISQFPPSQYLNIYVHQVILAGFNGLQPIFAAGKAYPGEGVAIIEDYLNTPVIAHEVGHYLGLYHTFKDDCPTNGLQSWEHGDYIIDTDPHESPLDDDGFLIPGACTHTSNNVCTSAQLGDVVYNLMNYCGDNLEAFTQCQAYRMHEYIKVYYPDLKGVCNLGTNSCTHILATARACENPDEFDDEYLININLDIDEGYFPCSSSLYSLSGIVDYSVLTYHYLPNGSLNISISVNPGISGLSNVGNDFFLNGPNYAYLELCNENGDVQCFTLEIKPEICDQCEPPIYISLDCVEVFPSDDGTTYVYQNNTSFFLPELPDDEEYTECETTSTHAGNHQSLVIQGNKIKYDFAITSSSNEPQSGTNLLCFEDEHGNIICKEIHFTTKPCFVECTDSFIETVELECGEVREDGYVTYDISRIILDMTNLAGYSFCGASAYGSVGIQITKERPIDAKLFVHCERVEKNQIPINVYLCSDEGEIICLTVNLSLNCTLECEKYGEFTDGDEDYLDTRLSGSNKSDRFNLSPNPTQGNLLVNIRDLREQEKFTLNIRNTTGKIVQEGVITQNEQNINMESLIPGIYFVRLSNINGETHIQKIIKL